MEPLYSGHLGTSTVDPSIPDTLGPVQWTPLFRTPWDQYSGPLYSGHLGTSTVDPSIPDTLRPVQWNPSIPDTLGPVQWTPLFRTPWDQYSGPLYSGHLGISTVDPLYSTHLGTRKNCPDYQGVLISGAEDVLWLIKVNYLVPVACVHIRGCPQFRGLHGFEGSTVIRTYVCVQ